MKFIKFSLLIIFLFYQSNFCRVVTKLLIQDDKISTLIFFLISIFYVASSYILHMITIDSPYIRYHLKACTKIVLRPDEEQDGSLYGVLNLDTPPTATQSHSAPTLSFSNPVYELSNPSAETNVESSLMRSGESSMISSRANSAVTATLNHDSLSSPTGNTSFKVEHILAPGPTRISSFRRMKEGIEERIKCARLIFPYMTCIALAYTVTLSLYPGLESEIISCNLQTWMPVLLMFTFNASDVIGKLLAAVPYAWSRRQLILMSTLRAFLIPLLLLCVAPRKNPTIGGELPAFIFTIALGITNGLAGSLPMLLAPQKVSAPLKELSGNIMTISYMTGLLSGSLIGYVFENMLGAPLYTLSDCPSYPYGPRPVDDIDTTLFTTPSTTPVTYSSSTTSQLLTSLFSTITSTLMPATVTNLDNATTAVATTSNLLNNSLAKMSATTVR
jgi:solute carrier family 29 (equilibrative nucleoside transporter) protein 4